MPEVIRLRTNAGAPLLDCWPESDTVELPDAVWRDVHPGADLAQSGRLLVHLCIYSARKLCIGSEQAPNAPSDDDHMGL
jgi:hypothetical protein